MSVSGGDKSRSAFDVGRRRSLNNQVRAAYDYQVAAYRENVLSGLR